MFEENLKLVYLVYNRRIAKGPNEFKWEEDIIQEGLLGLYRGCCTYDPSYGIKVSTYLAKCIENSMLAYLRTEERKYRHEVETLDSPIVGMDDDDAINSIDAIATEKEDEFSLELTIDEMLKCYEHYIIAHGNKTLKNGIDKNKKLLRKILLLVSCGSSYRTIAKKLGFSTTTITNKLEYLKKALLECSYV